MQFKILMLGALICISGCSHPRWDGRIESWGGMRQVMHDGQTDPRVTLGDLMRTPHAFGVGAVEGLRGEIVIDDGRCWVAQVVGDDGRQTLQVENAPPSLQATLLAVAFVPAWVDSNINESMKSSDLENYIREAAHRSGIDTSRPFPFVIEGQLLDLHAHVINGYCPMNQDATNTSGERKPFRVDGWSGRGKIIGLYAENSAGELTHHGTSLHMHVLTESARPIVAHVEEVSLAPRAKLRLPTR